MNILLVAAFVVLLVASVFCFVKPDKVKMVTVIGLTLWCGAQLFAPYLLRM